MEVVCEVVHPLTKEDYVAHLNTIVGCRLARVRYYECAFDNPGPLWSWDSRFDSLDFGLDLEMDDGAVFQFLWGWGFVEHDIALNNPERTPEEIAAWRVWEVSETSRWHDFVGKRISSIDVFWSGTRASTDDQWTEYPQDLRLTFETGQRVYLSALEIWDDGGFVGQQDNLTVFFDEATAKEFLVDFSRSEASGGT